MAATTATIGHTTSLSSNTAGSVATTSSWVLLSEIKNVSGPAPDVTDVEVTNLESPNFTKEFIPGLINGGEVSFDVSYFKTACATVYGLIRTSTAWKIILPDTSTWTWDGYIKHFGVEQIESETELKNSVTIKVQTKPIFTAA